METSISASTIVVLGLGSIWTGRYAQSGSEKTCAMFFIENVGLFISRGFKPGILVKGIMLNRKEDKQVSKVTMKHSPADNEPVAQIFGKSESPLDWKGISKDMQPDDLQNLFEGGMFFPFTETMDQFWKIDNDKVSVDMTGMLNALAIIRECSTGEPLGPDEDWNKHLADYMFIIKDMMQSKTAGIDIMRNNGNGFAPSDVFSVSTFAEMFLK